MVEFDASRADCLAFSYREGLLSPISHDLCMRVTSWHLRASPSPWSIEVEALANSLRVETALRDGRPLPDALSTADFRKIEESIRDDVLHAKRYPAIRFSSREVRETDTGFEIAGELDLHGVKRRLVVPVTRRADRLVAEVRIHQPDFGIKPFRAMLGAMRVQAEVRVTLSVPAGDLG